MTNMTTRLMDIMTVHTGDGNNIVLSVE